MHNLPKVGDYKVARKLKIEVDFLRPGMTVAEDIYKEDTLLIKTGVILTTHAILLLKNNQIKKVQIAIEPPGKVRGLEQTYHLTIALIKKFLLDFREFRSINIEVLDEIIRQVSLNQSKIKLYELTYLLRCKDDYTYNHSLSVALLTLMLGEWIEFEPHSSLVLAGLLHDIGKLEIDDAIIGKPGPLTPLEWEIIKKHPQYSAQFIRDCHNLPPEVLAGALYHHERSDGSGYPYGLKFDQIPSIARVISICDVFDAMTSRRPYKNGENIFRVLKYLYSCKSIFDWRYLETFVLNMLELLTGESVLLNTGDQGKLIFINRFSPFKPLVKVETSYLDLAERSDLQIESIVFSPS